MMLRRRRQSKGGRLGRRLAVLGRRAAFCALMILFVTWAWKVISKPVVLARREAAAIRKLDVDVKATETQNEALRRRLHFLNTPKGIEVEARRAGWVRPGEIALQPTGGPLPDPAPDPAPTSATPPLGAVRNAGGLFGQRPGLPSRGGAARPKIAPSTDSMHPPRPQ